ncbi:MAG: hypothetical protein IPQ13_06845 [Holophagaceae bacterium]|nr:hypothetical protein [Holophagaceae bacterium]
MDRAVSGDEDLGFEAPRGRGQRRSGPVHRPKGLRKARPRGVSCAAPASRPLLSVAAPDLGEGIGANTFGLLQGGSLLVLGLEHLGPTGAAELVKAMDTPLDTAFNGWRPAAMKPQPPMRSGCAWACCASNFLLWRIGKRISYRCSGPCWSRRPQARAGWRRSWTAPPKSRWQAGLARQCAGDGLVRPGDLACRHRAAGAGGCGFTPWAGLAGMRRAGWIFLARKKTP